MIKRIYPMTYPATPNLVFETVDGKRYRMSWMQRAAVSSLFAEDVSNIEADKSLIDRDQHFEARGLDGVNRVIRGDTDDSYTAGIDDGDTYISLSAVELKTLLVA